MKKIVIKVICIIGVILLQIYCLHILFQIKVQSTIQLVTTYIAKQDIQPRTCITDKHLQKIQIPYTYIQNNAIHKKEDIIGKYTDIQGKIPAGSLFYKSMLYDAANMPDIPSAQLYEGEAIYSIKLDADMLASLLPGQRVDVLLTIETSEGKLQDTILEHARIVMLEDYQGLSIDDINSSGIAHQMLLAINEEDIEKMQKCEEFGTFSILVKQETYDTSLHASFKEDASVLNDMH